MKLIGSSICPFVQRCRIILYQAKLQHEFVTIDLTNKPEWLSKISPMGKVPILEINGVYITESLIINELINEEFILNLQNSDPIQKAVNRGWSEFSSVLISTQYALTSAADKAEYLLLQTKLNKGLACIENSSLEFSFFDNKRFSLVDIAFAPLFYRLNILNEIYGIDFFAQRPKIKKWSDYLLAHENVKNSIPNDYKDMIKQNIDNKQGFLLKKNLHG